MHTEISRRSSQSTATLLSVVNRAGEWPFKCLLQSPASQILCPDSGLAGSCDIYERIYSGVCSQCVWSSSLLQERCYISDSERKLGTREYNATRIQGRLNNAVRHQIRVSAARPSFLPRLLFSSLAQGTKCKMHSFLSILPFYRGRDRRRYSF